MIRINADELKQRNDKDKCWWVAIAIMIRINADELKQEEW